VSTADTQLAEARATLNARANAIEEAYEFMLAYAGQGLASDSGSAKGSQVRDYLAKCEKALGDLSQYAASFPVSADTDALAAFLRVIDNDARNARAAVALVLAQPAISSQVVDNLNASMHLRAVLTDLFLVDEVLKGQRV
jgi:hypothetical protein